MRKDLAVFGATLFEFLSIRFPVCMASDEFHFFPQALSETNDCNPWDDFSPDGVTDTIARLKHWEDELARDGVAASPSSEDVERAMLGRSLRTLREQLSLVRVHESQPTYYLTIAGIGLAEALESGAQALRSRLDHLPAFFDQARGNLHRIPRLFRDQGIEMLAKQQKWLNSLTLPESCRTPANEAFARFDRHLEGVPVREDFRLPTALYEHIADHHMGCHLSADEIVRELESEIEETRAILKEAAAAMAPGRAWQAGVDGLPCPTPPAGGPAEVYRDAISQLARHCSQQGLMAPDFLRHCPVAVVRIPDYMRPVRSNAAFSMPPIHPPRGGTFFILETGQEGRVPVDYRLLTAHETFPGHHLLDTCRWRQKDPVRRHIEFPIFYEGWASLAEEILFDTGFFTGDIDRLLMAKRRFWRAIRGLVDVAIHWRRQTLEEAAGWLTNQGLPPRRALAMVRRYALKPGYQLAYTIGRRRFRELYDTYGSRNGGGAGFVRRVLAQGEIGFDHLERILRQGG